MFIVCQNDLFQLADNKCRSQTFRLIQICHYEFSKMSPGQCNKTEIKMEIYLTVRVTCVLLDKEPSIIYIFEMMDVLYGKWPTLNA